MGMAIGMAAMMAPSAAPFFIAYGRDSRRPAAVAIAGLIYVAAWAAIGVAVDAVMSSLMLPSSVALDAAAVTVALVYTLTPWSRKARSRCREMCRHVTRRGALAEGAAYTACCIVCSAGIMVALVAVLGMSSWLVIALGASAMLAYKLADVRAIA